MVKLTIYVIFIVSGNTVELNISSAIYAGKTISGSCIFTGKHKPAYIHIQGKHSNCTVEVNATAYKLLQPSHYINNFNITCLKSNITLKLKCFTNTRARMTETIKGMYIVQCNSSVGCDVIDTYTWL